MGGTRLGLFVAVLFVFGAATSVAQKEQFDRSKPHVNIGTIGHVDHGKTTLTAAITSVLAGQGRPTHPPLRQLRRLYDDMDRAPEEKERGITINTSHVQYETDARRYVHLVRVESPPELTRELVTGPRLDGAVLVVDAAEGVTERVARDARLSVELGVPRLVVFMNRVGEASDPAVLADLEAIVRATLTDAGREGDLVPIVRGDVDSVFTTADGGGAILALVEALDSTVPLATPAADRPFLLAVDGSSGSGGRGTVATGRIETGTVRPGDEVELLWGAGGAGGGALGPLAVVEELVRFGSSSDAGVPGDKLGLRLGGVAADEAAAAEVIAAPGTVRVHDTFEARVYVLKRSDGRRHEPFSNGYRPQFSLRTTDVTGEVQIEDGRDLVMPGDDASISVRLAVPVAIDEGLRFAIREGGRTVGAGQVSAVPD